MSYDLGFDLLYPQGMEYQTAPMMGQRTIGGELTGRDLDTYRSPDWGMTTATPYGGDRDWPAADELFRGGMSGWQPKCIARAVEGGMLVEAELPGVKREDVHLRIVNGELLLSGERKEEKSREGEGYWSRESSYGKFQRRLWLPETAQLDQIKAGFDNGMLNVFIPLPGRQREQQRMDMGQGRQMQEEGRQTYTEWGGAQAQPTAPRQEERGPIQQEAGTVEEMKPLPERREEMKPLSEEERKPLLEREKGKEKERMDTMQRGGSGIFIGSEATTTDASNV